MQVTICGPNLNDQSKGQFHVHAAGCADLKRGAQAEPEYRHGWTIEATTFDEVGDNIYADHIAEGSMDPGEGTSDCHFFPCCAALTERTTTSTNQSNRSTRSHVMSTTTTTTTPAPITGRFALVGEVGGQRIATGFWRNDQTAGEALKAAVELADQAGVIADLRLIAVDNAVLANPKATAHDLLAKLAPAEIKAHDAKVKRAAAAKAAAKPAPAKPATTGEGDEPPASVRKAQDDAEQAPGSDTRADDGLEPLDERGELPVGSPVGKKPAARKPRAKKAATK